MSEKATLAHITVLLHEAVDGLNVQPNGVYVDGTFGRGGHSRLILSRLSQNGRLFVFDKDPQAIESAKQLAQQDKRVTVIHEGFAGLQVALSQCGVAQIDGLLLDLGVSSPQLDEGERGFSFRFDAPLDMRMDTTRGQTAAQWLAHADEADIATTIRDYGEERFSRQIARAIVQSRTVMPIETTSQLADLVARVVKTREKGQHPATRTFQAIRIVVNRELDELQAVLPQAMSMLNTSGRLAVIAFHSLEDRIVKQFMRQYSQPKPLPKWVMLRDDEQELPPLTILGKAQKASDAEVQANPRARSAVLRVAERTAGNWIKNE